MADLRSLFKAYDIRGLVPEQLDDEIARAIGYGFGRFVGGRRLVVGRDMRPSGEGLAAAFIEGARAAGSDVVVLGLVSTDLLYFASGHLDAPGAMFTASHNPAAYNGIKLCGPGASPVGQDTGLAEVRHVAEAVLEGREQLGPARGTVEEADLLEAYAAHVRSFVDLGALAPLSVVADTANGMGGLVVPRVFAGLPFRLRVLYPELDGTFPNHPADPIQPENLRDLQAAVVADGADVGLAFDGDADRVFLVDERAEPVSGSLTTALVARAMLAKHPGATVLHNVICSRVVPETILACGGRPVRTRVGHSFIKQVMAETGAVFGGEHSGHYYFKDNYRADSGLIAALLVLEELSKAGQPLSALLAPLRRTWTSGEVNTEVADPQAVVEAVAEHYGAMGAAVDRLDGVTVDLGDWWFNVRPSNTEPLLRLNLESSVVDEGPKRLEEVLGVVRGLAKGQEQP
ncbi:phosphomannomutase/phosphoglucomutase [Aciditerrimonas ferrireducens]|jgi:phosphomannomutase|uniref:phosphomannomutase/phosphoglucomutase n=1 Tax=Aciditerrimonas ferrireducens TaxID=667306 RepID=UPI0020050364|nr:phosphomannomutase/phosphoglucomutase [Aciditerrimonas ferrireducens]MCK4177435.1 phosphomannomutase/phosphoglucomutase [Aciditerrimonas ferrireducens]